MLGAPCAQRRPGLDVQTIGIVAEDVAAFARAHGAEPVRVLGLAEVVARPDAVYWDRDHSTLVYTRAAEDGRVIFVPVAPGRAAKKRGRIDALVNAYKITLGRLAWRIAVDFGRLIGVRRDGRPAVRHHFPALGLGRWLAV